MIPLGAKARMTSVIRILTAHVVRFEIVLISCPSVFTIIVVRESPKSTTGIRERRLGHRPEQKIAEVTSSQRLARSARASVRFRNLAWRLEHRRPAPETPRPVVPTAPGGWGIFW